MKKRVRINCPAQHQLSLYSQICVHLEVVCHTCMQSVGRTQERSLIIYMKKNVVTPVWMRSRT